MYLGEQGVFGSIVGFELTETLGKGDEVFTLLFERFDTNFHAGSHIVGLDEIKISTQNHQSKQNYAPNKINKTTSSSMS